MTQFIIPTQWSCEPFLTGLPPTAVVGVNTTTCEPAYPRKDFRGTSLTVSGVTRATCEPGYPNNDCWGHPISCVPRRRRPEGQADIESLDNGTRGAPFVASRGADGGHGGKPDSQTAIHPQENSRQI